MSFILVATRAVHFWALAILFGGGSFLLLLKQRSGSPALRTAALLALVSGLVWLAFTFVGVTGDPADLWRASAWQGFFASPFGPPWFIRLVILLAAGIAALQTRIVPFVAIGFAAILNQAWLGHAITGTGSAAMPILFGYWIHVLAGLAWVGALTLLCEAIARRDRDTTRAGLALFATIGLVLVAAILASGVLNASFRIASGSDLVATDYGRLLMIKVALFAAMIGLAIFNRRQKAIWSKGLATSVTVETILGLGVLCAAAMLGITEPPA